MPASPPNTFAYPGKPILQTAIIALLLILTACDPYTGRSFKPALPGYADGNKTVYILGQTLLEISGQVNLPDNKLAAVNDEMGELFIFGLDPKDSLVTIKFGKKGDYEDLVLVDSVFYIIESNGDIHEVSFNGTQSVEREQYKFKLEERVEFESLVHLPRQNLLVMITKDAALDQDAIYAYSFNLLTKQFNTEPFFIIQKRDLLTRVKDYSAQVKPSAAALHPIENKIYLLASIGKQLMICTTDGVIEAAYDLNPDQFPQPEGISFASNGDMYISNEGLNGKATMLKFSFIQEIGKN